VIHFFTKVNLPALRKQARDGRPKTTTWDAQNPAAHSQEQKGTTGV